MTYASLPVLGHALPPALIAEREWKGNRKKRLGGGEVKG